MDDFADSRSRLELFLAGDGRSGGGVESPTAFDVDFDAGSSTTSEFGDVVDVPTTEASEAESASELKTEGEAAMEGGGEGKGVEALARTGFGDVADGVDGECSALLFYLGICFCVSSWRWSVKKKYSLIYTAFSQHMPVSWCALASIDSTPVVGH